MIECELYESKVKSEAATLALAFRTGPILTA